MAEEKQAIKGAVTEHIEDDKQCHREESISIPRSRVSALVGEWHHYPSGEVAEQSAAENMNCQADYFELAWLLGACDLFRRQQASGGVDEFEELGAVALLVGSAR